ncbi:MAG: O-antigen ligase family protein [Alcaligenaceae bacterium]|nr:O-antigen ligase family protein [Alcaligenaceae bacterium]
MTSRGCHTALLGVALALMAAGSLREVITPLGYWVAWLAWAAATVTYVRPRRGEGAGFWLPAGIMASYGLLVLGMLVSAGANRDWVSAYQALKIVIIAGMFLAMWWLALRTGWAQFMTALYWVVGLVVTGLVLTVAMDPAKGYVPLMGGGRQDSILAEHGVLWKAGALFLPMFLAGVVAWPRARLLNVLMATACVFIVLLDGSRTAQLVLAATLAGFVAFVAWCGGWRVLRQTLAWLLLVPVILVGVQLIGTSVNGWHKASSASVPVAAEGAVAATFSTRLGRGDPARVKLLKAGIPQAIDCLPLGCGFARTATDVGRGTPMPVHNAYLAALGDFGVLGLLGMLGFVLAAWQPIYRVIRGAVGFEQGCFIVAAAGSALGYGMALMLNTFTTEMSEWGYLIVMLAFAWAPARALDE